MSQIMIAHEKHGPRYLDMASGIGPVAKALLQQRVDAGCWYDGEKLVQANKALGGADPRFTPWHFLSRRRGEYEIVEIVDLEKIA